MSFSRIVYIVPLVPLESGDKCNDLEPGEPPHCAEEGELPQGAEVLRRITGGTIRLEERLRLLEEFNHLGDKEEAADESPGLREILTPEIKYELFLLPLSNLFITSLNLKF